MQILALAKRSLKEVARSHKWSVLRKEGTITTAASTEQYSLAADFDEISFFTLWDQTDDKPLRLATASEWQALQSSGVNSASTTWYFMEQGSSNDLVISFFPVPSSEKTYSYYYRSNKPCQSSGGTAQTTWAADTDTALVNEDLIALDLKWRYLNSKSLPYDEQKNDYLRALRRAKNTDGDKKIINFGSATNSVWRDNIPDRDFG